MLKLVLAAVLLVSGCAFAQPKPMKKVTIAAGTQVLNIAYPWLMMPQALNYWREMSGEAHVLRLLSVVHEACRVTSETEALFEESTDEWVILGDKDPGQRPLSCLRVKQRKVRLACLGDDSQNCCHRSSVWASVMKAA